VRYFTQARMRANCEFGISGVTRCSEAIDDLRSLGRTGAGANALSTRGLRADGTEAGTGCWVTCCLAVKSASAV
jgi:hypothetical protein